MCKFYRHIFLICILIMSTYLITVETRVQCNPVKEAVVNSQLANSVTLVKIIDGVVDADDFNAEIVSGTKTFKIPDGNFNITKSIILGANITIYAENNTTLTATGDFPIFKLNSFKSSRGNINIKGLTLYKPAGNYYHIELPNATLSTIEKCGFNSTDGIQSQKSGVWIYKTVDLIAPDGAFVNTVKECIFNKSSLIVGTSDSYIDKCIFWSNLREFAITLDNANITVTDCQIVGSSVHGGIYSPNGVELATITNNYFDGSYTTIDSGNGIFGEFRESLINQNKFWNYMYSGLYLINPTGNNINNNIFSDNNRRFIDKVIVTESKPDILLEANNTGGLHYNNIITNNIFLNNRVGNDSVAYKETVSNGCKFYNNVNNNMIRRGAIYLAPYFTTTPNTYYSNNITINGNDAMENLIN